MKRIAGALLVMVAMLPGVAAEAHMRLVDPPPINDNLTNGSSCGPVIGTPVRTQLIAGTQVNIHWIEVQPHDGTFRLSFSATDRTTFTTLVDNIPHPTTQALPRMFSQTITVPSTPCTNCTIQFGLNESGGNLNYVSCADVQIVAATPPPPADAGVIDMGVMDSSAPPVDAGMDPGTTPDAGTDTPPNNPPPPVTPPPVTPPPTQNPDPSVPPVMQQAPTPPPAAPDDGTSVDQGGAAPPTHQFQMKPGGGIEGSSGCRCVAGPSNRSWGLLLVLGFALAVSPVLRARSSRGACRRSRRQR
jgi:hypothetical protein